MVVAPSGIISKTLDHLRQSVANSSSFQTWVGAANATEALARIHEVSTQTFTMPFAVVDFGDNFRRVKDSTNTFAQEGDLMLLFRASINSSHSDADAAYTFLNTVGAILADIEALVGTAGYLNITAISKQEGPYRADENEAKTSGDIYEVIYRVEFD